MKILKNLFGKSDTKIDVNEIAVTHNGVAELLGNAVIVESGSNANGNYFKFGNGWMVCITTANIEANANMDTTKDWIFPAPFIDVNSIRLFTNITSVAGSWNFNLLNPLVLSIAWGPEQLLKSVIRFKTSFSQRYTIHCIAIGRWK